MKYSNWLITIIGIAVISSCNNQPKKSSTAQADTVISNQVENKIMIPASSCYISITGRDTIQLKVEKFPNVVTGTLLYNFYEKDDNNGTIDGKLNGDTLIAVYTFKSEGKSTDREVAFLITPDGINEGFGPMEEKDGKMIFKDLKAINFTGGVQFKKTACPMQ